MAKQGMKRPEQTHVKKRNEAAPVPQLSGHAKQSNEKANLIIADTHAPSLKVYHGKPHAKSKAEKPVPDLYPVIDNDLGRDNIENDITAADIQDLQ